MDQGSTPSSSIIFGLNVSIMNFVISGSSAKCAANLSEGSSAGRSGEGILNFAPMGSGPWHVLHVTSPKVVSSCWVRSAPISGLTTSSMNACFCFQERSSQAMAVSAFASATPPLGLSAESELEQPLRAVIRRSETTE
jgi:hypothetical protein